MYTSDTCGEVFKALAAFQDEIGVIPKGDDNPFFHSKYAGLPTVVAKAQPVLRRHGLMVVQTESNTSLDTRVFHLPSGEFFDSYSDIVRGEKETAQANGSALTYARRYAYVTALGLICDEDDDGNAASLSEDTPSERTSRKRRTKAEMAAAKASQVDEKDDVGPVEEVPVPDGWDDNRATCVAAHNDLAQRIAELSPEQIAECVKYRNAQGWPMVKDDYLALAEQVTVFEAFAQGVPV